MMTVGINKNNHFEKRENIQPLQIVEPELKPRIQEFIELR